MSAAKPRASKTVKESQLETSDLMLPHNANVLGNVFGGVILSMMDKTAAGAAARHARTAVVTVAIDAVEFREPIRIGDLVVMKASVNYVGHTSMEIGVRVEAENLVTGVRRHTNSAYLTYVSIDKSGKPIPVPGIVPGNAVERRRYKAAEARRKQRKSERISEGHDR